MWNLTRRDTQAINSSNETAHLEPIPVIHPVEMAGFTFRRLRIQFGSEVQGKDLTACNDFSFTAFPVCSQCSAFPEQQEL